MSASDAGTAEAQNSTESFQDDELSPPLFVRIQTIDLHSLDFQTGFAGGVGGGGGVNPAKLRNLTCIEATNLFLFVGSTSGTVYVFSRDSLKFLFIIPFKGGKVCSIACSQDEFDLAVGSIRGKVSLYRISPAVHYLQSSTSSGTLIDAFRDIYEVPHHAGAEITELQWSPNGKYLFVGDSQGIVSQMDVACLDEFPRPVPSKVILKLGSRVLQIDCAFPYLAVCTVAAVFLCDLEKEDFTRVQRTKNTDIRSTGLCLMILPERYSLRELSKERTIPTAKLMLFIGEVGTGMVHCCGMEGSVQFSKKIEISANVSKYAMPLFDPTKQPAIPPPPSPQNVGDEADMAVEEEEAINISLGKMLCTDDGMMVSVSSDRLFVYDPYTLNVLAWNENFKRINNFKIISNYAFIWAGSKLEVVAFTPFRVYAEQLYRARLTGVLENWIEHTVYSLGWRRRRGHFLPPLITAAEDEEESTNGSSDHGIAANEKSIQGSTSTSDDGSCSGGVNAADKNQEKVAYNFRKMLLTEGDEACEFTQFVAERVPFPIFVAEPQQSESESQQQNHVELTNMQGNQEESGDVTTSLEKPVTAFLEETNSLIFAQLIPPQQQPPESINSVNNDIGRISSTLTLMLNHDITRESVEFLSLYSQLWKSLLTFYEDMEIQLPQLDYKKSELTLNHVLHAGNAFLAQPNLVNLPERIAQVTPLSHFEDVVIRTISALYCHLFKTPFKESSSMNNNGASFSVCFSKFSQCPLVLQWFRELGVGPDTLFVDGLLADTLLLLLPFVPPDGALLSTCLDVCGIYQKLPSYFMTWLFLCKFLHKAKPVPYSPLLRSLLNDQLFDKLAEEMFSTIYRDFRLSTFGNAVHFLHHALSTIILLSKGLPTSGGGGGNVRNVSILLTCFPLKQWPREDIVTKIIAACHLNRALLGLYLKACLEDGYSMKLCACGVQAGFGTLEQNKVSPWQRAIEEAIIKLLLEEYFKSSPYEEDLVREEEENGNETTHKHRAEMLVHMFAMRRGLLEPYFRSPLPDEFFSEELQAELIIRSGSCASLKYFHCNERTMSLLLSSYTYHFRERESSDDHGRGRGNRCRKSGEGKKCAKCGYPLKNYCKFKPMSVDCLGMWALKQVGLEKFTQMVAKCRLNVPGAFSTRFYRAVVQFSAGIGKNSPSDYEMEMDGSRGAAYLSCAAFH